MDFLDGSVVGSARVAVRGLSHFFALFLVTILGPFLDPAGSPKSTQNATFGGKWGHRNGCFIDFSAFPVFSGFFMGFWAKNVAKINEILNVFFRPARVFFQTGKSQILCTGAVFWAAFTFNFFQKKMQKSSKKSMKRVKPEKWPQMTTRGVPE